MNIDLEKLKAAAKAAGGGKWEASDGVVWFADGDSALVADPVRASHPAFAAFDNAGAWPESIDMEDVAEFSALACPAAILTLIERLERAEAAAKPDPCSHRFMFFGDQEKRRCADCGQQERKDGAA